MLHYTLPVLFALFVWWFSTGAILYLDGLPRHTYRASLLAATGILVLALGGLANCAAQSTVAAAYCGFTCAVLIWAWLEMSYLMGIVTGPRKTPCPENAQGLQRFWLALATCVHHEIAVIIAGIAVTIITWEQPNQIGFWTFLVLWLMRWSAKLNLFLGVPNVHEEFLPDNLRYLVSYIPRKSMNLLFPISITVSTAIAALLIYKLFGADIAAHQSAGLMLVGTLLVLAILEHWFLVLPLQDGKLWQWALRARQSKTFRSMRPAEKVVTRMLPEAHSAEPLRHP